MSEKKESTTEKKEFTIPVGFSLYVPCIHRYCRKYQCEIKRCFLLNLKYWKFPIDFEPSEILSASYSKEIYERNHIVPNLKGN